jgi:hypothetical protein
MAVDPLRPETVEPLAEIYHPDVIFEDPIQSVQGREQVMEANRRLLRKAKQLRFEIHDAAQIDGRIFLTWTISFQPKLGPTVHVEGASRLVLREGLVASHRDYWDLAGSVLGTVPPVGKIYQRIAQVFA